jgi:L,D-transpeptidase-like protein/putative peptidoglycan binding protein
MRRTAVLVLTLLAATVAAAPASADILPPPSGSTPSPPPPHPRSGRAELALKGGIGTRHARFFMRGQTVTLLGRVTPFVTGQVVTVELRRRGRATASFRVPVKRIATGRGGFTLKFKARRRGRLRALVKHAATAQQQAFSASSKRIEVVRFQAGAGAHGVRVRLLQRGLRRLGFAVPVGGGYSGGTERAVLAFRKTNNMKRNGFASAAVYAKVFRGRGRFRLRHPHAGRHVEFDWSRQVLALADHGRAIAVYHASSGKPSTPTVFGTFHFYRKTPGTNSHGMLDSNYFIGGYAIHGYPEVPPFAASHGCIRVPNPNARAIYNRIDLGETILVYR